MAFTMDERPESPEISENAKSGAKIVIKYVFDGSNNYSSIRTQALIKSPVFIAYAGEILGRSDVDVKQQPGTWGYVDVTYDSATTKDQAIQPEGAPGEPNPPPPSPETPTDDAKLGSAWSLSTKGGTAHVTQSKATVSGTLSLEFTGSAWQAGHGYALGITCTNGGNSYTVITAGTSAGAGGPAGTATDITDNTVHWKYTGTAPAVPDTRQAIGVNEDGVTGTDVPSMKCGVSITFPTDLKLPLVRTLLRIDEPKTNDRPWLGFATGELLYTGAEVQGGDTTHGSLTMHFDGGENWPAGDARCKITPLLAIPGKKAHDYVWVGYTNITDRNRLIKVPLFAKVERLYDELNFGAVFGFG